VKKSVTIVLALTMVSLLILTAGQVFSAEKRFGLDDIPQIKNKKPIRIIIEQEAGGALMPPKFRAFTDKTGVKIDIEAVLFAAMYSKINIELVAETGGYDVVIVESSTTNEWAPYLYSMEELAEKFDPGGMEALRKELQFHHPVLLRTTSDYRGTQVGIPYDQYTQVMIYRKDVFEDPIEKANFKKRYGYELALAKDWKQLREQGEFFTRNKGDKLKGEVLDQDIYGLGLMAGRYEINDEISAFLWGMGGYWADTVRNEEGELIGYRVAESDKLLLQAALEIYKSLLPYTPPGTLSGFWDFVATEFVAGRIMIVPAIYGCCIYPWCSDVEVEIPGAKAGAAETIGGKGYVGCFHLTVPRASKNPEAAYWLVRYLTCWENSLEWGEAGAWGSTQRPFLENPQYYESPRKARQAPWMNKVLNNHQSSVNNYIHFNSTTMGKLYEMQIILCHEVMTGERTSKEAVAEWVRVLKEMQAEHGRVPVLE